MKQFLAVYLGSEAASAKWAALDEKTRQDRQQAGMAAWTKWAKDNAQATKDRGAPLGKTKRVNADGITDIKNNLAAYTIVEAESYEAAAKLFLNHPHFTQFPGDSVELMECLPIPGL